MIPRLFTLLASRRTVLLNLVLVAQAAGFYLLSHREQTPLLRPLQELPGRFENWSAVEDVELDPETLRILHPDAYLLRGYQQDRTALPGSLFVAYFRSQRSGHGPHTPQNCLPGQGWVPEKSGLLRLASPEGESSIEVNRYVVARGEEKSVVLYWYQTPSRIIANEYRAKLQLVFDSIRYGRSDTALVRLVVPVLEDEQAAEQAAVELAVRAHSAVRRHIPMIQSE